MSRHVCVPILGDLPDHQHLGCPVVRGVSLAPAPPAALARFRAIGGLTELPAAEATERLIAVAREAQAVAERRAKGLAAQVEAAKRNVAEADGLAASPIVGDERRIVAGFIAMIEAVLAEDRRINDEPCVRSAAHLRKHLDRSAGLDREKLDKALAELAKAEERCAGLIAQLGKHREKLVSVVERIDETDPRKALAELREKARISRDLPKAVAALKAGRDDAEALRRRFEEALRLLGEAA